MTKLKYISKNYVPKGQIEGFPLEVIDKMMEHQEEQGNEFDVRVFEARKDAGVNKGGFYWLETTEGPSFWTQVIDDESFDTFFKKYSKKLAEEKPEMEQGEWVPAEDFGVFEFKEDLSCEHLEGVEFLGALLDDEGDMEYFGLFMFDSGYLLEWDNREQEFYSSDISPDRLTHCAPYPKWPKPQIEEEIFELVDKWNCMQNEPIPDQNVRYLMDLILDWYSKKQKA